MNQLNRKKFTLSFLIVTALLLLNSCVLAAIKQPSLNDYNSLFQSVELNRTTKNQILDTFGIPDKSFQNDNAEYFVYYTEEGYYYVAFGEYSRDEIIFKFDNNSLVLKKKRQVTSGWGVFSIPFEDPEVTSNAN